MKKIKQAHRNERKELIFATLTKLYDILLLFFLTLLGIFKKKKLFFFFFFRLCHVAYGTSLTRDQTCAPCRGSTESFCLVGWFFFEVQSLNHWTTKEVPKSFFYIAKQCCI